MNVEKEQVEVWKLIFMAILFINIICTKHYIEEDLLLLEIKENLGGKNHEIIK